jgi:hypothetical protein
LHGKTDPTRATVKALPQRLGCALRYIKRQQLDIPFAEDDDAVARPQVRVRTTSSDEKPQPRVQSLKFVEIVGSGDNVIYPQGHIALLVKMSVGRRAARAVKTASGGSMRRHDAPGLNVPPD